MRAHQAEYAVRMMCRVLRVSGAGYYAWLKRPACARTLEDDQLRQCIRRMHADSDGTYGAPRIHPQLHDEGWRIGPKRVARLMQEMGVRGVCRRKFIRTTQADKDATPAKDLVNLAVVLDVFSRKIVGWALSTRLHTKVVLDALNMAVAQRRPLKVIHHSDQGSQFTSLEFGKRCRETGVQPSMGSVGDCYDNGIAERFHKTVLNEFYRVAFRKKIYRSIEQLQRDLDAWIADYNQHRSHQGRWCFGKTPMQTRPLHSSFKEPRKC